MKMNKNILSCTCFAVFVLMLSACGESTNLRDPNVITSTANCADLESADGVTCVDGRFIDDAVVNLDYSCGKVNATTGIDGSFACPAGTKVKFMLLNPDDKSDTAKKIVLGEVLVKSALATGVGDTWFYVTPYDFGSGAINIVRFLQSISRDTVAANLPSHRVIISDQDKKKLVVLPASLVPSDFSLPVAIDPANPANGTFDAAVKPFLAAISVPPMMTATVAQEQLDRGLHSTVAGAYFVPGYAATVGYVPSNDSVWSGDLAGMRGISPNHYLLGATWALVDRSGRITGFGVYTGGLESADQRCKILVAKPGSGCPSLPVPNSLRLVPDAGQWSMWNADGSWRLAYDVLNAAGNEDGLLSIVQGKIDRGAMAGSEQFYRNIFGVAYVEGSGALGKWTLTGGSMPFSVDQTSLTVVKSRPVAPTLDPDMWGSLSFPLNLRLSFWSANPVGSSNYTNLVGDIRITILEDGNIVSNLSGQCGAGLDRKTLIAGGIQEYPLGVVEQVFDKNSKSRIYISPIMMIPDKTGLFPAGLANVMMGTNNAASKDSAVTGQLRIRADSGDASAFLKVYDNADVDSDTAIDVDYSAYWSNAADFIKRAPSYDGRLTSVKDAGCP